MLADSFSFLAFSTCSISAITFSALALFISSCFRWALNFSACASSSEFLKTTASLLFISFSSVSFSLISAFKRSFSESSARASLSSSCLICASISLSWHHRYFSFNRLYLAAKFFILFIQIS